MTGHQRLVSVVLGAGITFAVATTLSILMGTPHEAFAKLPSAGTGSVGVVK